MRLLASAALILFLMNSPSSSAQTTLVAPSIEDEDEPQMNAVVFTNAALRDVITAGGDQLEQSRTADAALGIAFYNVPLLNHYTTWYASATIASTSTPVSANYGSELLRPYGGRYTGLLDVQGTFAGKHAYHAYFGGNTSSWVVPVEVEGAEATTDTLSEATFSAGVLYQFRVAELTTGDRNYGLRVELGPTLRVLGGDLGRNGRDTVRRNEDVLGTSQTWFPGLEFGTIFYVGPLSASFQTYYFPFKEIDGLTGGQLVAAIGVQADMFRVGGLPKRQEPELPTTAVGLWRRDGGGPGPQYLYFYTRDGAAVADGVLSARPAEAGRDAEPERTIAYDVETLRRTEHVELVLSPRDGTAPIVLRLPTTSAVAEDSIVLQGQGLTYRR